MAKFDLQETFYPRLVAFLAFGAMGLIEFFLASAVVVTATDLAGLAATGDTITLASTLLVLGTMIGGGMPTDN